MSYTDYQDLAPLAQTIIDELNQQLQGRGAKILLSLRRVDTFEGIDIDVLQKAPSSPLTKLSNVFSSREQDRTTGLDIIDYIWATGDTPLQSTQGEDVHLSIKDGPYITPENVEEVIMHEIGQKFPFLQAPSLIQKARRENCVISTIPYQPTAQPDIAPTEA